MSELGEAFSLYREVKRAKRESNKSSSTKILSDHGIDFETKNNGTHLIIGKNIDYWPSTGLWMVRETGKRKRGIFPLIKYLKAQVKP